MTTFEIVNSHEDLNIGDVVEVREGGVGIAYGEGIRNLIRGKVVGVHPETIAIEASFSSTPLVVRTRDDIWIQRLYREDPEDLRDLRRTVQYVLDRFDKIDTDTLTEQLYARGVRTELPF